MTVGISQIACAETNSANGRTETSQFDGKTALHMAISAMQCKSICQGKDIKTRLPERIGGIAEARLLLEGNIKKERRVYLAVKT